MHPATTAHRSRLSKAGSGGGLEHVPAHYALLRPHGWRRAPGPLIKSRVASASATQSRHCHRARRLRVLEAPLAAVVIGRHFCTAAAVLPLRRLPSPGSRPGTTAMQPRHLDALRGGSGTAPRPTRLVVSLKVVSPPTSGRQARALPPGKPLAASLRACVALSVGRVGSFVVRERCWPRTSRRSPRSGQVLTERWARRGLDAATAGSASGHRVSRNHVHDLCRGLIRRVMRTERVRVLQGEGIHGLRSRQADQHLRFSQFRLEAARACLL